MKIAYTRAMVNAALDGELDGAPTEADPVFGFEIPTACPEVPHEVLTPRNTWKDPNAYETKAKELAARFIENFQQFASDVPANVQEGGPRMG